MHYGRINEQSLKKDIFIGDFYKKVGLIVGFSQMIEYKLAMIFSLNQILCAFEQKKSMFLSEYNEIAQSASDWYETLSKSTLGSIINKFKAIKHYDQSSDKVLEYVLKERNFVIHQLFKEDIGKNELLETPKAAIKKMDTLLEKLNILNLELCEIIVKQKEEYSLIL